MSVRTPVHLAVAVAAATALLPTAPAAADPPAGPPTTFLVGA
ncbi:hypothetical protein ACSNN7_11725 [Micromonospora sp. URMC 105]